MELFDLVLDPNNIYETLFFNVKSATEYADVWELKKENPKMFKQWELICGTKYGIINGINEEDAYLLELNNKYQTKAIFYPEFSKIVAITYATVEVNNNKLIRKIKIINDIDEFTIIKTFQEILSQISKDGIMSNPQHFPILCGHNIINYDIPLFLKRLIALRDKFEDKVKLIPFILKKYLNSKPWDNNIIDTINLWKFNGISNTPLSTICDFLDLKRNVDVMEMDELSKYYWNNIDKSEKETLDKVGLQSANQINLIIQLLNEIRIL